jgi:hypothetical protein
MFSSVISKSYLPEEEVLLFLPDGLFRGAGGFLFKLTLPEDLGAEDDEPDPLGFMIYKKILEMQWRQREYID